MDFLTLVVAGFIFGSITSILSSIVYPFFSGLFRSKTTIKVGPFEVKMSADKEKTFKEIADRISDVQESPHVFLSYSRADAEFVNKLVRDLRQRKVFVWTAEEQLRPGDFIEKTILGAIESSQWVIVVVSRNTGASTILQKELDIAIKEEKKRERIFVIPVLIDHSELPAILGDKTFADFRANYDSGLRALLSTLLKLPLDSEESDGQSTIGGDVTGHNNSTEG